MFRHNFDTASIGVDDAGNFSFDGGGESLRLHTQADTAYWIYNEVKLRLTLDPDVNLFGTAIKSLRFNEDKSKLLSSAYRPGLEYSYDNWTTTLFVGSGLFFYPTSRRLDSLDLPPGYLCKTFLPIEAPPYYSVANRYSRIEKYWEFYRNWNKPESYAEFAAGQKTYGYDDPNLRKEYARKLSSFCWDIHPANFPQSDKVDYWAACILKEN